MLKYIRDEKDMFYLFSNEVQHKDVAESLRATVKSAGFYMADGEDSLAYGKSPSLDIGALPDDIVLIKQQMAA